MVTPTVAATASYDVAVVALSFFISFLGALAALETARSIKRDERLNPLAILVAAVALGGVAVWSMHFVGMEAYRLPVPISYARAETLVSMFAAIIAAGLALWFIASGPIRAWRFIVAGSLTGLGVAAMHYLGMYGMRFDGFFLWDAGTVALSVLIAMVAATAALWLAVVSRTLGQRIVAALIMAIAVCSMHYTGMAAASPMCRTGSLAYFPGTWARDDMQIVVTIIALMIAFMVLVWYVLGRAARALRLDPPTGRV